MELQDLLKENSQKDPTWQAARNIVQRIMTGSNSYYNLIRAGWSGSLELAEMVRMISFSGINPSCLIEAAELPKPNNTNTVAKRDLESAIITLGVRFSTLVLAVNATVASILSFKPPTGWRKLLESMISDIHIGYFFGLRSNELGMEGGALIGFAKTAGLGILMADNPQSYRNYVNIKRQNLDISQAQQIELFGCEPYQISAILLQSLGFGTEAAVGAICGLSDLHIDKITLDYSTTKWRAAFLWIEALKAGRDYPAEVKMRNAFPALRPSPDRKIKNPALEMLYVEVAKIRQSGSPWLWHLPKADYNATREAYGL